MDRDFQLSVSIGKALSPSEAPLKMKHARSVIIATHRLKGAKFFWAITTRQPLMEHRFTAWKFCHVLHKVLREGHENTIRHSQVHKTLILEVGKLWGHLQDGVGKCIESYTQLLVNKLDFHQKNMGIPGAITMDFNEIRKVTGDDLNNYFQLCVEIFDYLDYIIALQAVIFTSINTYRMSSMTPQGQCRLAPLITLIQDSNPLYDLCVRVLFRLHDGVPHDILSGHRSRFNDLFSKLKIFYETVRPLQYFSDIIQLPHLPDNAPNFSSVNDVGNYTAPVMHVYQEEELPPMEESLLDLSNTTESNPTIDTPEDEVDESQIIISNLQEELRVRQMHIEHLVNITREMSNLKVRNEALESEIGITKEMLKNTAVIKDNLELKLKEMEELEGEVKEGDEKYKQVEEKFEKIKTMYGKLREDHIQLLRMRNDDSKQLIAERKKSECFQTEINNLKHTVEDYAKTEEQNSSLKSKMNEYEDVVAKKAERVEELESELVKSKALFEKHDVDKSAVISEYENQLLEQKLELKKLKENYDIEVKTKQHEMHELLQVKLSNESSLDDMKHKLESVSGDKDNLRVKVSEMDQQILQLTETHETNMKIKQGEVEELLQAKLSNESVIQDLEFKLGDANTNNENLARTVTEMTQQLSQINEQLQGANHEIVSLKRSEVTAKATFDELVSNMKIKQGEVEELMQAKFSNESAIQNLEFNLGHANKNNENLSRNVTEMTQQISEINEQLQGANHEIASLKRSEATTKATFDEIVSSVNKLLEKNMENDFKFDNFELISIPDVSENNVHNIQALLQKIKNEYKALKQDSSRLPSFMSSYIELTHAMKIFHEHIMLIFSNTTDMGKAEELRGMCNGLRQSVVTLYQVIGGNRDPHIIDDICQNEITLKLNTIQNLIRSLQSSFSESLNVGDMLQQELKDMDSIIEEATKQILDLLLNTKSQHEGIQLEVNEKILDSCTHLMKCIVLLIQRSRELQNEIVSNEKGSFSAKEFYKRNSQWTEGLISASKNIAKGAKFLVDAANKTIVSDSAECFELIVAAQDIAASTAQLVIASKVKAKNESVKLVNLTKASRDVSMATGQVVATVRDGNSKLEYKNEIDVSKLTPSQKKTMEMEMQIKVLQLEHSLQSEQQKLMSFRKAFYQSADDD